MTKKPLAYEAYQKLADSYAAKVDSKPHNAYYERPAMLELLPDVDGQCVLDAGCGPGAYAEELVRRGAMVTSFDVSDRMLKLAAERLKQPIADGKVMLREVDMSQPLTMFADESFDLINAPLCCDYIEDWNSLFAEFFRILKPGGTFLFSGGHPSFDAEYFKTKQYYSVEQVNCVWKGFGVNVNVPSFRRSLSEFINPVIEAGFTIDKVVEPQPTEEFRKADPRRYKILTHRPCFLCVRVRKPG